MNMPKRAAFHQLMRSALVESPGSGEEGGKEGAAATCAGTTPLEASARVVAPEALSMARRVKRVFFMEYLRCGCLPRNSACGHPQKNRTRPLCYGTWHFVQPASHAACRIPRMLFLRFACLKRGIRDHGFAAKAV